MATGRTLSRWMDVYIDEYEVTGYTQQIGPLITQFNAAPMGGIEDGVQGGFNVHPSISPGVLNAMLHSTVFAGDRFKGEDGTSRTLTIVIGIRGVAAIGDPCFCGKWYQDSSAADLGEDISYLSMQFGDFDVNAVPSYEQCWGHILHPSIATVGANSSGTGVDDNYLDASSAFGGYMVYHASGDGTATIKVQHSADEVDGNYADLGGCTTGVLDMTAEQHGIVETTATTTTVNRYLRWQLTLGTATTVTFALSFVRAHRQF